MIVHYIVVFYEGIYILNISPRLIYFFSVTYELAHFLQMLPESATSLSSMQSINKSR